MENLQSEIPLSSQKPSKSSVVFESPREIKPQEKEPNLSGKDHQKPFGNVPSVLQFLSYFLLSLSQRPLSEFPMVHYRRALLPSI